MPHSPSGLVGVAPHIGGTMDRPSEPSSARWLPGNTRRLGVVLGLPLADGVFATLVIAGVLETAAGILMTGIVIFGGSAAAAVVLADLQTETRAQLRGMGILSLILIPVAGLQATLAPSIAAQFNVVWLERVAALVLVVIAAEIAGSNVRRWMPRPGIIVLVGVLVSLRPDLGALHITLDGGLFVRGALAAFLGVAIITMVIVGGPGIRRWVNITRLRFGSAISLGVLAVALLGSIPKATALIVLLVAAILAISTEPPVMKDRSESAVDARQ